MARPCAFMTFLVLRSYYWSTCSLGCELPQTYNLRSKRTLTLFTQMRRLSLLSYLKNRKKFAFPLEKVDAQQFQKAPVIPAPCPAEADPAVPDPHHLFLGRQPSQTYSSLASTRGSMTCNPVRQSRQSAGNTSVYQILIFLFISVANKIAVMKYQ